MADDPTSILDAAGELEAALGLVVVGVVVVEVVAEVVAVLVDRSRERYPSWSPWNSANRMALDTYPASRRIDKAASTST
jgi:hypothetical protein